MSIKPKVARLLFVAVLLTFGLVQYFVVSFDFSANSTFAKIQDSIEKVCFPPLLKLESVASIKPLPRDNTYSTILHGLESSGIPFTNGYKICYMESWPNFIPEMRSVWESVNWMGSYPFVLIFPPREFEWHAGNYPNAIIYVGTRSLLNPAEQNTYIGRTMKQKVHNIKVHPSFINPTIHKAILNGDHSSLFPPGYKEGLQKKFQIMLAPFSLFKTINVVDRENTFQLFIYTRE